MYIFYYKSTKLLNSIKSVKNAKIIYFITKRYKIVKLANISEERQKAVYFITKRYKID